jgi:hypothetical protein
MISGEPEQERNEAFVKDVPLPPAKKWWVRLLYPAFGPLLRSTGGPGPDGFATDLTDHRNRGEWETRYPTEVHEEIVVEAVYLVSVAILFLATGAWAFLVRHELLHDRVGEEPFKWLTVPAMAMSGGGLGGTLFGLKWLYHSVAKGSWSLDRRLWRFFTPWISAVLALAFMALVASDVLQLFNSRIMQRLSAVFGVSFLVGYFSDTTIGKLNEVVNVLFGRSGREERPEKRLDR